VIRFSGTPAPWILFSPGDRWALGLDLVYEHEAQGDDELTGAVSATAIADTAQPYKETSRRCVGQHGFSRPPGTAKVGDLNVRWALPDRQPKPCAQTLLTMHFVSTEGFRLGSVPETTTQPRFGGAGYGRRWPMPACPRVAVRRGSTTVPMPSRGRTGAAEQDRPQRRPPRCLRRAV